MGRRRARTGFDMLSYRVRMLPVQLERARKRVEQLETEAVTLGLTDLLERPLTDA